MSRLQVKSFKMKATHKDHKNIRRGGVASKVSMWPIKLMNGFRKILLGFFSLPPRSQVNSLKIGAEEYASELPKRSCSSSVHAHYDEAIADCIEFINKSSKGTRLSGHGFEDFV